MARISVDIAGKDPDDGGGGGGRGHPNTCPICRSHYRDDELETNLHVCRQCGHHFRVGARTRIAQLADEGSFAQIAADLRASDPLAFVDLRAYSDRLHEAELQTGLGEALVAGAATIGGRACVLAVMDFGFMAGSMGSVVGEVFARACDLAIARGVPLVSVASSGGARMQENILALMQMAKTVAAIDELHEAGIPYISVIADPTTGGVIASFAALGDVCLAEPQALMSFAGPRVVQQTTREQLPDDFGRAEANLRLGHVDAVVVRSELKPTVTRLLRLLRSDDGEPTGDFAPPAGGLWRRLRRLFGRADGA